ncbi:MAG: hypothetical protein ACRBDI_01235 [Alphaproteobacteria bacterium]
MSSELPSDKLALQIWWAMMWRAVPLALLAGAGAGFVIGIIAVVAKTPPESIQTPSMLLGGLLGVFVTVKVIKRLMTHGFGNYRLMVVKK